MMRPGLNAAGDRVRLPAYEAHVMPLLDALAVAYTEEPEHVGQLLTAHAVRVLALDVAQVSESMPEYERSIRAAEADDTREALLMGLPADVSADPQLTADDAITTATRLTRLAARIRHTRKATP
ncbi:hypothetical protein [Streptomyces halstedii]|uniref:Uncharacterized protein n=1 Tax=Streptomyces halstedii TaxID=1944 RepID=A0A6N9UB00_STRHA|nr:hypothetical protein [Streptomyces halstedii]NEA19849.1 hypothetical protein [Streptomyces halstedii]